MPLDPGRAGLVDEHVRQRMRKMARQGDEAIVRLRVDRDRGRSQVRHEAVYEPITLGVCAGEWCQEPRRTPEELRARVLRPSRLGAADGMTADESGRVTCGRAGCGLRGADVGDGAAL